MKPDSQREPHLTVRLCLEDATIRYAPAHPDRTTRHRPTGARPGTAPRLDAGFTLVELMMAIVLSSIIGGVLVAALMTSLNAADSTSSTVASSIDTQLISTFLAVDAQAAGGTDPGTAREVADVGVSTVADAAGWAGCEQAGALVVRFAWIERSVSTADKVVVTYGLSPDGSFVRRACEGQDTTTAVLGRRVTSANVSCDSSKDCAGIPDEVTLALAGGDSRAPFDVTLSASLRPEAQGEPTSINSAEVPLLAIGTGSCPALSLDGSGATHVLGAAIGNTSCGASPISGDLTLLRATGTTSLLTRTNNPFADTAPPAVCDRSAAPKLGSSDGPDSVTLYSSPVTISSSVEFQPGRHVFCNGLTVEGGATVTGSGVLWYVVDGGVTISEKSTVSLTPAMSGDYAGLLLWSAGPQTVRIASAATVHDLAGVVYVPRARLDLVSTTGIRLGAAVADQVAISGSGPTRFGQPSPTLTVAAVNLPGAFTLRSYSATAPAVSGGTAPYTYSATGLPPGLTMSTSGAISGAPTSTGTATVSFLAIDATGASIPFTRTLDVIGTPPAPQSIRATAGDATAAVSWTAGVSSGAPATSVYSVSATATGLPTRTCSSVPPTTACTLTGLVNGATYAVAVTATNSTGTSPPGATAVTPRPAVITSSNSRLWLDATDPDADGVAEGAAEQCNGPTVSCTAAADVLTRWEDKSGNDSDATQSTSTMAGRLVPGMPAVNFDANGFYTATVRSGPDMTAFVVAQSDTSTWNTYGWLLASRVRNGLILHPWPGGGTVGWYATNSSASYFLANERAIPSITSPHIYDLTQAGSSPIVASGGLDGHPVADRVSFAGQARTATSVVLRLGADDCCGVRNGDGKYREVIVFDRALTSPERRSVQEYLARKWSIAVTPAAPTAISALAADGGALVSWAAPTWNGGSAVTGYRVTAVPGGITCTAAATATTCSVLGLTNGTPYVFVVSALNAVGIGDQSTASNTITPGPPPAPTMPAAVPGDGLAVVSWVAPVLNGHVPVLSYTVSATASGQATRTCTATAPSVTCTVTGMTNNVDYALSITAANAHGNGPAATTTVTPNWTPTDLGTALTWWYDANASSALTGSWITQTGYSVSGTAGSTRLAVSSGVVERIDVVAGGSGYTSAPTLTIGGGGGSGASVSTTTVSGGALTSTMVPTRGSGYTSEPTVAVGGPGTGARVRAFITAPIPVGATIRFGGQSYTVTDRDGLTVTISPALTATAAAAAVEEWQISNWSNRATPGILDAQQPTVANRPALGTMAGRPAAVFDGTDTWMSILADTGTVSFDKGPTWTVLVAYQAERQVGWGAVGQTTSGSNSRIIASSAAGQADIASVQNLQMTPNVATDALNGGPVRIATMSGTGADTFEWSRAFIGATAAPAYGPGFGFTGRIGEILFVNGGLDSATVTKAQAYLTAKWAQPNVAPAAPIVVTPSVGDGQVSLTWRGANSYLSTITNYTATATAFGQTTRTCITATLTCTITGLTNGAVYSVSVVATNGPGAGAASVPVAVVTRPALLTSSVARLWLDGADTATVFGDAPCTNPLTVTGTSVMCWRDKSPRAISVTSTTLGPPTSQTASINGLSTVRFQARNATDPLMSGPDVLGGSRTDMQFFLVRRENVPSDNVLVSFNGTPGSANRLQVNARSATSGRWTWDAGTCCTTDRSESTVVAAGAVTVFNGWKDSTAGRSGFRLNGAAAYSSPGNSTAGTAGGLLLGTSTTDHDIAELIVFERRLTPAEERQVEEYLSLKWGVVIAPSAPTAASASQARSVATVAWAAPTSNGGSPITGYTATASPGGASCTSVTTSCTISGLVFGVSYTFTAVATNAVGTGVASTASAATIWGPVLITNISTPGPWNGVFDGTFLWVSNDTAASVSKIEIATNAVVATVAVGGRPTSLVYDGTSVWVTNWSGGTVSKINATTNAVTATLATGSNPYGVAFDGTNVWVANQGSNSLSKINPTTNTITNITVGSNPTEVTFAFGSIWFSRANSSGSVVRLDPATNAVTATITVGNAPYSLTSDGSAMWVVNRAGGTVSRINPATNTVTATITTGSTPYDLAFLDNRMWVTLIDANAVIAIDTATNAIVAVQSVGRSPYGIVATPTTGHIWVMNWTSNTVSRYLI